MLPWVHPVLEKSEATQGWEWLVYRGGVAFQALRVFLFLESCFEGKETVKSVIGVIIFYNIDVSFKCGNHHHFSFRFEIFHKLAIFSG